MHRHRMYSAIAGALLLLAAPTLTACDTVRQTVISVTAPMPGQAKRLGQAEILYTGLARTAKAFIDTGLATPQTKALIKKVDQKVYDKLVIARKAQADGDNALVAVALDSFDREKANFHKTLKDNGAE